MKKKDILYGIVFFAICLVPSVGLLISGNHSESMQNAEKRALAELPQLVTEDGINVRWLSDAGTYFEDHFGFRSHLITANAKLRSNLFGVSAAKSVIDGTEDWLYYSDSLDDFQGTDLMSERSLYNLAHSLAMTQKLLADKGADMYFTVAPNKNTLYPEHMPTYLRSRVSEADNLERLEVYLEGEGVNYIDLKELLTAHKEDAKEELEELYHARDSHWNNQGASIAAAAIMDAAEQVHPLYEQEPYEIRTDFAGDLDEMLFPEAVTLQPELYYTTPETFAYVTPIESTFDPMIQSVNPSKTGSLVMYRDSFGNALVSLMAEAYGSAYFSRGVPYQLSDVDTYLADTVVIERAQRFLPNMAANPPMIEAGISFVPGTMTYAEAPGVTEFAVQAMGMRQILTGFVDPEYMQLDTKIYARVNGEWLYEAFPMSVGEGAAAKDNAFSICLNQIQLMNGDFLEIVVQSAADDPVSIYQETYAAPEDLVPLPAEAVPVLPEIAG